MAALTTTISCHLLIINNVPGSVLTPLEMLLNLVLPTAVYGTNSYSYFTTKETETQKRQTFLKFYSCITLMPGFKSGFADLRAHAG